VERRREKRQSHVKDDTLRLSRDGRERSANAAEPHQNEKIIDEGSGGGGRGQNLEGQR